MSSVGYALCFNAYSSWKGKALYLYGLYVKPVYRDKGVGRQLFDTVVKFARDTNCNHMDFHVQDFNPVKYTCAKLKAVNLTKEKTYQLYRLTNAQINDISNEN